MFNIINMSINKDNITKIDDHMWCDIFFGLF